jgi:hypothetical protein
VILWLDCQHYKTKIHTMLKFQLPSEALHIFSVCCTKTY